MLGSVSRSAFQRFVLKRPVVISGTICSHRYLSSTSSLRDIFSSLRWRAADVLTSGLTAEERAQLLEKLDAVDRDSVAYPSVAIDDEGEEEEELQKTIGEAVAAARMEEAQRQESKWLQERERLMQEAEEAARSRIENDLKVQERRLAMAEQWKKDLNAEAGVVVNLSADHHPVLGQVVADFGYKKIYQVSANTLKSIPVWKKQRLYRHERAKVIATDKLKTLHLGMPGILVLHEDGDGKLSILDGQHRVGALALIAEKAPDAMDLENILVEVYSSSDEKDLAEEIFVEINKSEPIKLVDMPGVAKAGDRNIITSAAAKVAERYPEMFKPSQQCRVPHLNIDNLRDALFASEVLKRHDIKSSSALVNWITAQNDLLAAKFQDPEVVSKVNAKALEKAKKYDFYLGMESSWLYN